MKVCDESKKNLLSFWVVVKQYWWREMQKKIYRLIRSHSWKITLMIIKCNSLDPKTLLKHPQSSSLQLMFNNFQKLLVITTQFHHCDWFHGCFYKHCLYLVRVHITVSLKPFFFFFCLFAFSRAAHGGSQARGLIWAVAASLRQSHSNAGSKSRLRPTPQLRETLDP